MTFITASKEAAQETGAGASAMAVSGSLRPWPVSLACTWTDAREQWQGGAATPRISGRADAQILYRADSLRPNTCRFRRAFPPRAFSRECDATHGLRRVLFRAS